MIHSPRQTALELFAISLYEKGFLQGNGDEINALLEQAKAMHKEEIIRARLSLDRSNMSDFPKALNNATDYYNETFGGNK